MGDEQRFTFGGLITTALATCVLASLLAMQLPQLRAAARRVACANNLMQLGLAAHNYHAAYRAFPFGSGGTDRGSQREPVAGNASRLSGWVALTPFFEQQKLWEEISNPLRNSAGTQFHPMGPVPWYDPDLYAPWGKRPRQLVCTDDPAAVEFSLPSSFAFNYGDSVADVGAPWMSELPPYTRQRNKRGSFMRQMQARVRDVLDGTSYSLMFAEVTIGATVAKEVSGLPRKPKLCENAIEDGTAKWAKGRLAVWADGSFRSTGFNAVLPPNGSSCTSDKGELEGVISASSHHGDGAHVVFVDGSVHFVSSRIDSGDSTSPSVSMGQGFAPLGAKSPYGLWGALGSIAGAERINRSDAAIEPAKEELSELELAELRSIPIQRWTLKDGTQISGRLLGVRDRKSAEIVLESGKSSKVTLEEFADQDAYVIVASQLKKERQAEETLVQYLEECVLLLDRREIEGFLEKLGAPQDRPEIAENIRQSRGRTIQSLEDAILAVKSKSGKMQIERSQGSLTFKVRNAFELKFSGKTWHLDR